MDLKTIRMFCVSILFTSMVVNSLPQFPTAHRPPFAPRPTYTLVSQIVPSGQPWPANAADYDKFSQTTRRPGETPIWATTTTVRPTRGPGTIVNQRIPEVDDRRPDTDTEEDHKHWSRPTIIFHEPFLRSKNFTSTTVAPTSATTRKPSTSTTYRTTSLQTEKPLSTSTILSTTMEATTKQVTTEPLKPNDHTPTVIRLPEIALFTSAPVEVPQLNMGNKIVLNNDSTIGVANLLPDNMSASIKQKSEHTKTYK